MAESDVEVSTGVVVDLTEKTPIRVLHVDDEAGFLKVAKQCLEMQGLFQVETASSVEEAMEKMKKKTFDVIVSDYVMPGKDGLEFLKGLRESGNDVPFIIFTGKGREEVAIKALNLGADRYLNKGGDPETVYGELAHSIFQTVSRKRAEEMLRRSEEKYRNLFENAKDVIVLMDLKGNITSINKAAVEYGFKKGEVIGKNMRKFVPKKYWPKLLKELVQIARGKTVEGKIEIITPKGKKDAEYRSDPMIVDNRVVGVQGVLRDITEHKRAGEELIRLSSAAKMTTDSIVISDIDAKIIDVNEATLKMYGTDHKKDLIGKNSFDLIAPEDREKALAGMKETLEKGYVKGREYNIITKDGGRVPVEMTVALMKDVDGKPIGFVGISRNITERKKIEEELRSSEQRLKVLFQYAPDAYYLNDLKSNFVDGNRAAEELTGYSKSELIGKSFLKLKLLPRSQIPKAAKLLVKNALGKPTGPDEFILNRKDGTQVSVEIRTFPVKIKGQTLVLGIARDISERKRAETALKTMNEKLRVVGRLTRHDVRNKLSAVTGNVFLAKRKLPRGHEALGYLSEIEPAIRQVQEIFDFARTYEMLGAEELTYMDVKKTVGDAVSLFSDLHGVKVTNDCRGLTVLVDSLLRQLFYNLIHNSLKHGEKVTRIRVYYEENGKDTLKLVYEDDGVGIPKAEKEKIFMEGYGKGTGYGLYLIRKMCEVYGWAIRETGKHGKGAQFTITIPKVDSKRKILYKLH